MTTLFHFWRNRRGTSELERSPTMRAQRAKLKSRRDDEIVAQGGARSSLALGWYMPAPLGRRTGEIGAADAGFCRAVFQDQWPGAADLFRWAESVAPCASS